MYVYFYHIVLILNPKICQVIISTNQNDRLTWRILIKYDIFQILPLNIFTSTTELSKTDGKQRK